MVSPHVLSSVTDPWRGAVPWLAPVATTQLGLMLAWAAASSPPVRHSYLLISVLATVALVAAARMATASCIESRVAASAVGFVTVTGVALASTVGLPGAGPRPVDPPAVVLALVALLVMALAAVPQSTRSAEGAPYAS